MASERSTTRDWFGADARVGRTAGLVFKWACLGATGLALGLMLVFLLYVFNNAVQPATADTGWLLTFAATVVLPAIALAVYYRRDRTAGRVAYTALGLPIVAALTAGGVWIFFAHIFSPHEWFALAVSVLVAAALVEAHARIRTEAELERFAVVLLVPALSLFGIPNVGVDYTIRTPLLGQELFTIAFSIPQLLPSVRALLLSLPVLPMPEIALLLSFTAPIAAAIALRLRRVRESERDARIGFGALTALAAVGLVAEPVVGVGSLTWIVFATIVVGPCGLYAEHALRRREGSAGLVFPLIVGIGVVLGWGVVTALGFSGPDAWLDASFLTSAHDTTPSDAGIYPALVGTMLILVVIVVSAIPVGVGAAIYLEEYAHTEGVMGRIVDVIEINVANLASVPSVVYGVVGLAIFVTTLGRNRGTALVAGLTVGMLILPIVIVSAQEAIRAVPDSRRQAAYGMGATRWQTIRTVVLPEALPGVLTGTILSLGRAIGETAPLLMVAVPAVVRTSPHSFTSRTGAMPRQIYTWSTLIDTDFRYGVLAAGVVTLLVVLLTMNATAIVLRNRYQRNR